MDPAYLANLSKFCADLVSYAQYNQPYQYAGNLAKTHKIDG